MAYKELIKNFNRIREYLREFYVYGFKNRDDFAANAKSARTYDDEKRRLESWLGDYMCFRQNMDGKTVFLSIDPRNVQHNPLYKTWKTKSFTDTDITLHFILLDILVSENGVSLKEILTKIDSYLCGFAAPKVFDESTIRKKLNEYIAEGIVTAKTAGKTVRYTLCETCDVTKIIGEANLPAPSVPVDSLAHEESLVFDASRAVVESVAHDALPAYDASCAVDALPAHDVPRAVDAPCAVDALPAQDASRSADAPCAVDALPAHDVPRAVDASLLYDASRAVDASITFNDILNFYSEVSPCGVIGSYLLDKTEVKAACEQNIYYYKHHYITAAMDSEILYEIFDAIRQRQKVKLGILNRRSNKAVELAVVPLQIFISVQSGRQYLMAYEQRHRAVSSVRLDNIYSVAVDSFYEAFDEKRAILENMKHNMWGVSTNSDGGERMGHIDFTVYFDDTEEFIYNRLVREKRCGTVTKIDQNHAMFSADIFNATELIPWIRTFICRITDIRFSNRLFKSRFKKDLQKMYELYEI